MTPLSKFEKEVLLTILRENKDKYPNLESQLEMTTVTGRENSGAGFFVDLQASEVAGSLPVTDILGHVQVEVDGLQHGLGFVIFLENGRLSMLEGFSYGENTFDIDLSQLDNTGYKVSVIRLASPVPISHIE